jgi:hypothetical protein
VKKSKATVEEHLDAAFASLDEYTVRELEATSEAIGSRRHPLFDFSSIFRDVASAREGGRSTDLARFHLGQAVSRADEGFFEQIADAPSPFWVHARCAGRAASVAPNRPAGFPTMANGPSGKRYRAAEHGNGFGDSTGAHARIMVSAVDEQMAQMSHLHRVGWM